MSDSVPEVGDTTTYTRTFTNDDVQAFAELSKDDGYHHLVEDDDGTLIVHGLLTATLPTKLGGDIDYVARTMEFEFPRPVYTGQQVTCEMEVVDVREEDDRYRMAAEWQASAAGQVVMSGRSDGVVFK